MKIAIFTDTYAPEINGVVTSIKNFTKLLGDKGHEIMIYCPKYDSEDNEVHKNIKIKRLFAVSFINNKDVRVAIPSPFTIINELRKFKPDIVHIQTPMTIGCVALTAAKMMGLKNIQTYHTYIPGDMVYLMPKAMPNVNKILDNSLKYLNVIKNLKPAKKASETPKTIKSRNRNMMNDAFAWTVTRAIYNRADLIITPTEIVKNELKNHGIGPEIKVLSNGVDLSVIVKKSDYSPQKRILHGGRLGFEKSVDVALGAFGILAASDKDVVLDIASDGPARGKLEKMVTRLKLEDRVNFLGFLPRKDLNTLYAKYDFLINASTMETQGLVILEAMAAGLSVLGVNKLAAPELIKEGVNGYLSAPFNENQMAENMKKMYEVPNRLEKFGRMSLVIASKHDLKECADKLLSYYKNF